MWPMVYVGALCFILEKLCTYSIFFRLAGSSTTTLIGLIIRKACSKIHCRQLLIGHLTFSRLVQKVKLGHKKYASIN